MPVSCLPLLLLLFLILNILNMCSLIDVILNIFASSNINKSFAIKNESYVSDRRRRWRCRICFLCNAVRIKNQAGDVTCEQYHVYEGGSSARCNIFRDADIPFVRIHAQREIRPRVSKCDLRV